MSQPTDNVYLSISFPNIPRDKAEEIVQNVEELTGDHDVSFDWSDPIGENDPTPVADQAAEATGGDPTAPVEDPSDPDVQPGVGDSLPPVVEPQQPAPTSDSTGEDTDTPVVPEAPVDTPAPVVPDVEPTDAPVLTATDGSTEDDGPQLPGLNVPPPVIDQSSER
jgi:hypothetical protein